jgi:hypothetical protein
MFVSKKKTRRQGGQRVSFRGVILVHFWTINNSYAGQVAFAGTFSESPRGFRSVAFNPFGQYTYDLDHCPFFR